MKPLRRLPSLVLALLLLGRITPAVAQSSYFPEKGAWERRRPEALGLDPVLVQQAIQAVADGEVTSPRDLALNHLMTFGREPLGDAVGPFGTRGDATALIVYRGYIVAEDGEPGRVDQTFSVAKSFLSSVVGIAWDRGLIRDLNARVGPEMAPVIPLNGGLGSAAVTPAGVPVSQPLELFTGEHNSTITWDHLLRQTSDWEGTLWGKPDWADRPSTNRDEWTTRPRNPAGSVFEYNDVRVNLLALAALNVWRRPLPQVAKEHLFDRIGASDTWRWTGYDNSWILLDGVPVQSVSGGSHWGGGLFINAYDLARFGLLTLHRGRWAGQQVLSDEWVTMAMTSPNPAAGYGFMNWYLGSVNSPRAFSHEGAGPNTVYVDPENELVVVTRWTSSTNRVVELMMRAMGKEPQVTSLP